MTDHERVKAYKKGLGLDNKDIAEITGLSYGSIKVLLSKKELPRWMKLVLYTWEQKSK